MGKVCAVKSCPTGRKRKNVKKNYKAPKSLSFFRPTTLEKLEKWKEALRFDLKPTDYICHLHFKEEHIRMYEKYNINGELKILFRGKNTLKDEAIPTIEHQFIPMPEQELKASLMELRQKQTSHSNDVCEQLEILLEEDEEINYNLSDDNEAEDSDQQITDPLLIQETNYLSKEYQGKDSTARSIKKFQKIVGKLPMLPPLWLYFQKTNVIEFMRIDPISKQALNHIRLNEDLLVTVIFANNEEFTLNDKITSFHKINDYLKSVEKWPRCVGTQIDVNRYARTCRGVIVGADAHKNNRQHPRCKFCRILRNRLQNLISST